jgi:diguanylate cyclase (GGDEF)-like protein/hemerythrin-like metal-binding protein/PAS domain S-box-containing protein
MDIDIPAHFFEQTDTPKLIFRFDSATDSPTSISFDPLASLPTNSSADLNQKLYFCEHRNSAAVRWIRFHTQSSGQKEERLEGVFEAWGVLDEFYAALDQARREGHSTRPIFSKQASNDLQQMVELHAFMIHDRWVGVSMRTAEEIQDRLPLNLFLSVSLDLLCMLDPEGYFIRINPEFSKILGYEIEDLKERTFFELVHPEDLSLTERAAFLNQKESPLPYLINRFQAKTGDYLFLHWKTIPYPPYTIASARDISEAFSLSLSLEKEFVTDPLTGVKNRKAFEHEAKQLLNSFSRNRTPASLIMADIDHFKRVNDTFGHPVGDQALIAFAKILTEQSRASDSVTRVGGEEFALLLPNTEEAGAYTVAEKIRDAVSRFEFDEVGQITASFGVAEILPDEDLTSWYTRADTALYIAKHSGRNCTVTSEMLNVSADEVQILPWRSEFESGNEEIDQEHRELFLVGERLMKAYYDQDHEKEKAVLEELFDLLAEHFENEEQILHEAGYLDLVAHREIHQSLLESADFWKRLQERGRVQSSAFYAFLINKVIGDHLLYEDAKYFGLLRGKKSEAGGA